MTLKVMTWNLENLFRPGSGDGPTTQAAYDEKLAGLAAMINQEQPHALAVQELGDPDALARQIAERNAAKAGQRDEASERMLVSQAVLEAVQQRGYEALVSGETSLVSHELVAPPSLSQQIL
jgi:hypothetical protein